MSPAGVNSAAISGADSASNTESTTIADMETFMEYRNPSLI